MAKQKAPSPTVNDVFEKTKSTMQSLGTYRPEFDETILIYSQLVYQYRQLNERFEKSRYKVQTQSAQGGMKKSPIVATLENLRRDIVQYSDRLCLNPKSLAARNGAAPAKPRSKLDEVMEQLMRDG